ncbi:hypothetical protein BU17DRAFT_63408, partial [Hysterangium stoloniferum]
IIPGKNKPVQISLPMQKEPFDVQDDANEVIDKILSNGKNYYDHYTNWKELFSLLCAIISDEELNTSGRMDNNKKITRENGIRSLGAKHKNASSEKEELREHIGCGGRRGGYLGYGLYKYAFEGKIQEKDFALFEWKEVCCQFNEENFQQVGIRIDLAVSKIYPCLGGIQRILSLGNW